MHLVPLSDTQLAVHTRGSGLPLLLLQDSHKPRLHGGLLVLFLIFIHLAALPFLSH